MNSCSFCGDRCVGRVCWPCSLKQIKPILGSENIVKMDDDAWFDVVVEVSVKLGQIDELLKDAELMCGRLEGGAGFMKTLRASRHAIMEAAEKEGFGENPDDSGHSEPEETCGACRPEGR